jgi:hypothetical protein
MYTMSMRLPVSRKCSKVLAMTCLATIVLPRADLVGDEEPLDLVVGEPESVEDAVDRRSLEVLEAGERAVCISLHASTLLMNLPDDIPELIEAVRRELVAVGEFTPGPARDWPLARVRRRRDPLVSPQRPIRTYVRIGRYRSRRVVTQL